MIIKTASAMAILLAMSDLPTAAQVRNWLAPLPSMPEAGGTTTADVLTFMDTSINFGPRARVRVYRPEGVYEIDNSGAGAAATDGAHADETPKR